MKQNYLCKFHKSSECKAKCYLLFHNDSNCVSLLKSYQHNEHEKNSDRGILEKFKNAIDEIYEIYKKPSQIKRQMVNKFQNEEKESLPSEQQLVNYLKYKRIKAGVKPSLNLGELEQWCLNHISIPDDPDAMFVKRSFTVVPKTHKVLFYLFFTTKRLLEITKKSKHICADATYKLLHHGYPLLIVGTTDKNKSFHPFGVDLQQVLVTELIN